MVEPEKILKYAVDEGYITQAQLDDILPQLEARGYEAELDRVGVSNSQILQLKSAYFGVPGREITVDEISEDVLKIIPEKTVKLYSVIAVEKTDSTLTVGFVDPSNLTARQSIDFIATAKSLDYKLTVITQLDFERVQSSANNLSSEVGSALTELETELTLETSSVDEEDEELNRQVASDAEAAPVTKIVATIIRYASEGGASDIHIEPYDEATIVRFRIDGTLQQRLKLPASTHPSVVARIKILANMRIDEKRKPQDGRFSAHVDGRKIDFRVSTFPTSSGEKVVMRLLDTSKSVKNLSEIGLSDRDYDLIKAAINEPFGLILISGPTGSGKSTTLYSMLQEVDRKTKNVLSLEDPVEYEIEGVSQSSINADIGYTFASGLRTTLRQDPDIIMVGEIRDKETAELAIQAALTGHLVLSTIHTNSATGVIPRMVDMGIDPYLIAPTLKLAMGQRLVKSICPGTGKELPIEGAIRRMIDEEFKDLPVQHRKDIDYPRYVLSAEPTPRCPKGTSGRQAVFEVMKMSKKLEEILLKDANESDIYNAAREDGMLTMREDAILKAFNKEIPFEEVNKLGSGLFAD